MADVVDAFENDEVFDAGLGEHIAVEAGERAGAGVVVEDAVAADALVEDAESGGLVVGLQAAGEDVGPAGVGVAGAESAVGDAVAEGDDGGRAGWCENIDAFEEGPVGDLAGVAERGCADGIAGSLIAGLVGEAVQADVLDGLGGQEDADGEVGEGGGV